MSRYLVTGAAGFVGSHITDRLIAEGQSVVGIDNFETGQTRNLQDAARVVRGDIADFDTLDRAFNLADPDVVFHCAASYRDRDAWNRDIRTNVLGTAHVVKLADQYGARIIYFQTALCYGHKPDVPIFSRASEYASRGKAVTWGQIPIWQPIAPDNSYSISKTAGESYIIHSGVPYVSIRMANVYGPRNLSGPIPTFAKNLIENRKSVITDSRRDFIYIDDLLDLVWLLLESYNYAGVIHASSGTDFSIADVYVAVEAAYGQIGRKEQIPRPENDAPSILLDPSDTERLFGWRATTPLSVGIASAVEWYVDNPPEATFTHLNIPVVA